MSEIVAIPKTLEGLRDALFDEINLIRAGKSNPQRAKAISQTAARIVDSIRVQIQYGRLLTDAEKQKGMYLGAKK